MTIAMLSLAGFPATAGFFGKIYLIEAAVDNELRVARRGDRARLGDLARPTTCAWWRRCGCAAPDEARGARALVAAGTAQPAIAGGSQEADEVLDARSGPATADRRWDHGRRGGLRERDDLLRDLPLAAPRRRQRRRRGVAEPAVARGEFSPRAPISGAVPPPRPIAGQASAEYVALLAVVCAVVAGAAAVGSVPPIAAQVARQVEHGICLVAGGICTPGEARAAGLGPCLVRVRTDRERLGGRVLVVKVGRGDSFLVQRRSDGTAAVSFADGGAVGASFGLGLQFAGRGADVRGGGGLQFTSGRTWEFPDRRGRLSLRAPLGAHGDADRRAARDPARRRPPAGGGLDLQGGWRVRRVHGGGRAGPGTEASLGAEFGAVIGDKPCPLAGTLNNYVLLKLTLAASGNVELARPDKVRASRSGGFADIETVFDGKTLTILHKNIKIYPQFAIRRLDRSSCRRFEGEVQSATSAANC